jgi:hypothetical protein
MESIEERGQAFYEQHLKLLLEPEHNGQAVAIHLDTGDYKIHRNWAVALRELRELHPDGETYALFIGPPAPREMALATLLAGDRKP